MKPDKFTNLGKAVHHWLSFQLLCGREQLMSESYLNQPTGEYLLNVSPNSHLKTEYDHPCLNEEGRLGRPRQIDFCLLSRDTQRLTTAIELKWVNSKQLNKQRIVQDLLRLECLRGTEKGQRIYRYLVVAGRINDFNEQLLATKYQKRGNNRVPLLDGILATSEGQQVSVIYQNLSKSQQAFFDNYAEKYNMGIPARFETKLEFGISEGAFCVYGWHIKCSSNRKEISPTTRLEKNQDQRSPQTPVYSPVA